MKVGFIGIGTMGEPMAENLLKAGFLVTAYDINEAALEQVVSHGASRGESPKHVTTVSDVVITMLPSSADVEKAVLGPNGVVEAMGPGKILIDMSTIDPLTSRAIASRVEAAGGSMIDAPVSGGQVGAKNGTLTIMVSGKEQVLNECRAVLTSMGKNIVYVGEVVGMGETVKLVNNLISGVTMIATTEAFLLGLKAGLPLTTMYEVVKASSGNSWTLETYFPRTVLQRNFDPGFMLNLMYKDIGLALALARDLGLPLPLAALCHQLYQWGRAAGNGRKDYAVVWDMMAKASGVEY